MTTPIPQRIEAALGRTASDLVLRDASIVNVFTAEVTRGSLAISGDTIVAVGEVPDGCIGDATDVRNLDGSFLVPGYIDAHMHVGGSYAPVAALATALLERGTTTLATDMYELYAMNGVPGVAESIEQAEQAGLRIVFMPPAHLIGLERLGTFAHPPSVEEFRTMAAWPQTYAINEPPPFVVLGGNHEVLTVVAEALAQRSVFEGHVVGIAGAELQAYAAAGASSDHEAGTLEEARERLRLGYRVIMREGSAARDLPNLAPLLLEYPRSSRFMMVCTDEIEPKHLIEEGHIDHKLRTLVAAGVDPVVALQTATINTAEYFGLSDRIGSLAPGRAADVLALDELESFRPSLVVAGGRIAAENGRAVKTPTRGATSQGLRSRVVLAHAPVPSDFALHTEYQGDAAWVRVIGMVHDSLVSEPGRHLCAIRDGIVLADPTHDVLRVAVMERHEGSGRIGRGFILGLNLRDGAVAMTYCHVHQNLLVIGTSDEQMALAAEAVARLGGGMAIIQGGNVLSTVTLPVGGVLSDSSFDDVAGQMAEIEGALRVIGCRFSSPVLAIAFSALPTIPAYGLTDFGLYDVSAARFVDVLLPEQAQPPPEEP
jgi:adenine deaminase